VNVESLLAKIARDSGVTDPERILLISRISANYLQLMSQKISGGDVTTELAIVEASVANLDRALRQVISNNLQAFLLQVTQSVLVKLVMP
tara:strand:+ start:5676 stop:5945 length:270 start_codon:yes stop_codon:yes gene_type:complete